MVPQALGSGGCGAGACLEEPVAGDEAVAREMGKLASQLSLAPSPTALFLCLAVRGWGGERREEVTSP